MKLRVTFYASQQRDGEYKDREKAIAEAYRQGIVKHGDECRVLPTADVEGVDEWANVAAFVGVKGYSRLLMDSYLKAGKHITILDKGYLSGAKGPRSKYCRVSVDSFQPLDYFQAIQRPDDRLRELKIELKPSPKGQNIIVAGGSLKYALWHNFNARYGYDPMTTWAADVINYIAERTKNPIVYRPKPSWNDARPLPHSRFSRPPITIDEELANAKALVTFGSNAAVDAIIAGVPVIVTGDGIAKPLSRTHLKQINDLYYPTDEERYAFLCNLTYIQFNLAEFESGLAWDIIKPQIEIFAGQKGQKSFGDEN